MKNKKGIHFFFIYDYTNQTLESGSKASKIDTNIRARKTLAENISCIGRRRKSTVYLTIMDLGDTLCATWRRVNHKSCHWDHVCIFVLFFFFLGYIIISNIFKSRKSDGIG